MNTIPKLVAVLGLAFTAGCGAAPEDEPVAVQSASEALRNTGGYTTRGVCAACGCVASDVACDCGTPPSKRKLACIDNGGPVKSQVLSEAALPAGESFTEVR